ncbi:sulfate adenylyltransferase [Candidatus Parcubacteria bacterium]|nr:sulfate adenylyltransferase [Candidatus Parcubacteria bacterium]
MKNINVKPDIIQDAINISNNAYAPLTGFLKQADFNSVIDNMRLANGRIWSIPIIINISAEDYQTIKNEKEILLVNDDAIVRVYNIEFYSHPKAEHLRKVYGTLNSGHPMVNEVMGSGDYLLGGDIEIVKDPFNKAQEFHLRPDETKKEFARRGWEKIVAFQTRNVPHRGHEFLLRKALESADGLLVHPVVGDKKIADFKDEYIIASYKLLLDNNFKDQAVLAALPIKMRYGGPREALMHALIRRNFGCTHFIVGRDHAGVGNFYAPQAAQEIFNDFSEAELGIKILPFNEVVYNKKDKSHGFIDEYNENDTIRFSGTKLRDYIKMKVKPPEYLIRQEVYNFLINASDPLVDNMYKQNNNKKGFALWFTGLSASGKTTVADQVYADLKDNGARLERLDGDVVRERLTKGLGFDREGRNENIRRIGFVADMLSRNGVGVMASFITPYVEQRDELRETVYNYIEVFVDAPLSVCEQRDPKGLYKKARAGEIPQFTGIDDPYDKPKRPDIHIKTDQMNAQECSKVVLKYLKENNYI